MTGFEAMSNFGSDFEQRYSSEPGARVIEVFFEELSVKRHLSKAIQQSMETDFEWAIFQTFKNSNVSVETTLVSLSDK